MGGEGGAAQAQQARHPVALARKMAVVMHRMWTDGTAFRPGSPAGAAAGA